MAVHELSAEDRVADATVAALLDVRGVEVIYGASAPALRGVSLTVRPGQAVALLGANGAGKTTTIRAISGLLNVHQGRIVAGSVRLDGDDVTRAKAHAIVARGLAQVPEGRMVFGQLTVDENLRIGTTGRRDGGADATREQVLELFPVLRERFRDRAGYLSGGEQQMLAIGRALMAESAVADASTRSSLGLAPLLVEDDLRDRAGG